MRNEENAYQSWLWGEVLLFGLLGATLALFVAYPDLRPTFELPQVRLVLDTMVALAAVLVAVLAGVRFSVDGRRLDLLLCAGFSLAAGSTFCFGIAPVLGGQLLHRREQWAWIWGGVLASALIAAAAFARKRTATRRKELIELLMLVPAFVLLLWILAHSFGDALPARRARDPRETGPVPRRRVDARDNAPERRRPRDGAATAPAGRRGCPAGGRFRGPRPLVGERHCSPRRGAPPLRRLPDRGRSARSRSRDRRQRPTRARRADRGVPDRPGGSRQRAKARGRPTRRRAYLAPWRRTRRQRDRRRLRLRRRDHLRGSGAEEHEGP